MRAPLISIALLLAASASSGQSRPAPSARDAGAPVSTRTATPIPPVAPPTQPAAVCALGAPGTPVTAAQVALGVQAFYDRTNDYEADFLQVSSNRLAGQNEERRGHMRFRRPGRMRWDYAAPAGDIIVSNGTTLWAYESAANQAIQSSLTQSQMPSALSFLMGTGRLTNDFTFRLLDSARYQYPTGLVLEATPVQPNPSFVRLLFYVDRASCQVSRTVVFDAQGNSNRFTFTSPRVNTGIADPVFAWSPPRGAHIVRP